MARSITSIPARETITSEGNAANIPKKRVAAYCRVSTDEGISGTNTKRREQFNKMIKDCRAGEIDVEIFFEQGRVTVNEKKFLGYDKDEEKNLIINKNEAKIVKRIYTEFLNGKGATRIARELERDKVRGVTGSTKWYTSTINKIHIYAQKLDEIFTRSRCIKSI